MSEPLASASNHPASITRPELLRRFLEAYWLRPENALWMTLRSDVLSRCAFDHPSIDLSCGDGVFSFLHAGGAFHPDFDVFQSVGGLDRVRDEHADMFDFAGDSPNPRITEPPADTIDVGTDMKPTLLAKAEALNLYGRLVEHDSNQPLPFADGMFRTVYCNAAYWVENIAPFLAELARITARNGRVVLQVKLDSCREYTLDRYRSLLGDRFLDLVGRGRLDTWVSLTDRATWESRFESAGLDVSEATPFVTKTHAHLWDIGLRPLAPLLVKMTRELSTDVRASIKREWVDLLLDLLTPFRNPDIDLTGGTAEPAEIQYVLTPR